MPRYALPPLSSVRLNLAHFFRWSSLFILFVAAGLAAGAIRAFHEAGLWNHFQATAFDISSVLSVHSLAGTLLEGLLAQALAKRGGSGLPLVIMVFLAVAREGLESVFFLLAAFTQDVGYAPPAGALLGLLTAALLGTLIYYGVGVIAAIVLCAGLGIAINATTGEFPQKQQELFEGVVALIAVVMLTTMVFWMRKVARSMRLTLEKSVAIMIIDIVRALRFFTTDLPC
ncbi:hypothetical protein CRX72_20435 [Pantoea sp. BRM17]|nr:hypothetical protein CRX72_20435 [Pantoea sp. BRM17]